ncbi:MAG: sulfatase family protein [Paludibacter sp.]
MYSEKKEHLVALALLVGTLSAFGANPLQKADRPNIVWFVCEDISPMLPFYGDSTAHTPNLDKLAKESMIFDNCYTTVGVCAPSRSTIITGMYPTSIGTMDMRTARDVFSLGKRTYATTSVGNDLAGNPIREYSAVIPEYVKCFPEYLRAAGYYCTNNDKTDYQFAAPVTAWDENDKTATWENHPANKPFFAVYEFAVTHESKVWLNKNLPQTVSPKSVPLPPYFPDDSVVRQDVARVYSNIEILDKQIGEAIQKLKNAGLYDKTIIVFCSDNGGPLPRGKREIYDSGLHLPFIIRFPKGANAGRVSQMISFVDLAPTTLSLAGIKPPEYMQGQAFLGLYKSAPRKYIFGSSDRFDEFSDRIRIVRDSRYLFVKNYHPELPPYKDVRYRKQMDMMRELLKLRDNGKLSGPTALWFRPTKTKEEFYDCQTDPFNMNNLIDKPEYVDKIKELRNALDQWESKVGDMGAIPEGQMIAQMWPNNTQPTTLNPVISISKNTIKLTDSTPGNSIGYILSDKKIKPTIYNDWQLYHEPVQIGKAKYLYVIANRIGFKDSEIIEKEFK